MLKGISHVHSTFSFDGKVELQQVHALFASRGFDFVLMSEHIEELDLERIQRCYDACLAVSDDRCVLIPGIEIDALHILIFAIERPDAFSDLLPFAAECHRKGALIVLSHPVKIRRGIPDPVLPMLDGVEVWNTRYDGRQAPRPASLALFRQLRRNSPRLVAFCGMDFHRHSDYAGISLELDARGRTPAEIREALRAGRVRICSDGRPIPIYPEFPAWARTVYAVKSRASAAFYDGAVTAYRRMKGAGIQIPMPLRRIIKRII